MRRSPWIICIGPQSSDKCPHKRHTEEKTEEEVIVTIEAEIGVTQP